MIEEDRLLLMRYINNANSSLQLFNNIINTINNQDSQIYNLLYYNRFNRRYRRNRNNVENVEVQNIEVQNQIDSILNRLSHIENNNINRPLIYTRGRSPTWRDGVPDNLNHIFPTMTTGNIFRNFHNFNFESVRIRPTQQQISQATETIPFSQITNPLNNRCPITLIPFGTNQEVIRIINCQHIFDSSAINQWFRNNVRCPVCRFDIREHNTTDNGEHNTTDNGETTEDVNEETIRPPTHRSTGRHTTEIADAIRQDIINQISNIDPSGNLTIEYSFITPTNRSNPIRLNNDNGQITWSSNISNERE